MMNFEYSAIYYSPLTKEKFSEKGIIHSENIDKATNDIINTYRGYIVSVLVISKIEE